MTFPRSQSQAQKTAKERYQDELANQIEEKRLVAKREKDAQRLEDEKLMQKIEEDNRKLQEELEKEKRKEREKFEAVSLSLLLLRSLMYVRDNEMVVHLKWSILIVFENDVMSLSWIHLQTFGSIIHDLLIAVSHFVPVAFVNTVIRNVSQTRLLPYNYTSKRSQGHFESYLLNQTYHEIHLEWSEFNVPYQQLGYNGSTCRLQTVN